MKLLSGYFQFQNRLDFDISLSEGNEISLQDVALAYIGKIFMNNPELGIYEEVNDILILADLYRKYGKDITYFIHGMYTVLIFDKERKELIIFQDMLSSPLSLYYTKYKGKFFFSTSLKLLLKSSSKPRALNDSILDLFLLYGFVPESQTLIKDIYKLKPGYLLAMNVTDGSISFSKIKYWKRDFDENYAKEKYVNTFKMIINDIIKQLQKINVAHSQGYDSNYIVYTIKNMCDRCLNAFSVGGIKGKDESKIASKICDFYDNVNFCKGVVGPHTFKCLPDIVWILEGAVYEKGIFLMYELGKLLEKTGETNIIIGEGADEVGNINFFNTKYTEPQNYTWKGNPFEVVSYRILKKSSMLNAFSIDVIRPYLYQDFIHLAKGLRNINLENKYYHKDTINQLLKPQVRNLIRRKGGSTYVCALFDENNTLEQLFAFIQNSKFLKRKLRVFDNFDSREEKIDYYISLLYIFIFNDLFITGKYDNYFEKKHISILVDGII